MILLRSRYLGIGVALLFFFYPGKAAAGCHTDCSFAFPNSHSDCLTCGFRALSNVTCYRSDCNSCDTLDCSAALPRQADQWASNVISDKSCPASSKPVSTVRVVKVQKLAARG